MTKLAFCPIIALNSITTRVFENSLKTHSLFLFSDNEYNCLPLSTDNLK